MTNLHHSKILIVDFGSQYTRLIARRVRELGVYCEVWSHEHLAERLAGFEPCGIILSGGPASVNHALAPTADPAIFDAGVPILGICYGMQWLARSLGGSVAQATRREYGHAQMEYSDSLIFSNLPHEDNSLDVWMSHGDHVTELPEGFSVIAHSDNAPMAAIADEKRHLYGLQFHPEVTHTECGQLIFSQFVLHICRAQATWTPGNIIDDIIERVQNQVGDDKVILGLSGGVDSMVSAVLLHRALGEQLHCIFVDNGLLRHAEAEEVVALFRDQLGINLHVERAADLFLGQLAGIDEPEQKRKMIGALFVDVFERAARDIKGATWLAQGTIYSDVIESAGLAGASHVIKSHHNVGGLPQKMSLKVLEPLRELFKDEVRKVGLALGLAPESVFRHPFPGPALAVRVVGEVKPEYLHILRQADRIFIDTLRQFDWYHKISQAFAVFLPIRSVAVMGDARVYDYVIALRAVETTDFMTAHWAELPYELLKTASNRIINEIQGVSRVTYDISSKPPATIEWE